MAVENNQNLVFIENSLKFYSKNQFQCTLSKNCVDKRLLCDGKGDCDDNSDETVKQCGHTM